MKKLIVINVLILSLSSIYCQNETIIRDDYIWVNFNSNLSISELVDLKELMKEYNIDLSFHQIILNKKSKVKGLEFTVKRLSGSKGKAFKDKFRRKPFGFYFDQRPNAKSTSGVGTLKKFR